MAMLTIFAALSPDQRHRLRKLSDLNRKQLLIIDEYSSGDDSNFENETLEKMVKKTMNPIDRRINLIDRVFEVENKVIETFA